MLKNKLTKSKETEKDVTHKKNDNKWKENK